MPRFTAPLKHLLLDKVNYTKTLNRVMGQIIRESTREGLRYIIEQVPVETGDARSTLVPIAEYLNNVRGLIFAPQRDPYFNYAEQEVISPAAGMARQSFDIIDDNLGEFYYEVSWSPNTVHYWTVGFYKGQATPGWELLREFEIIVPRETGRRLRTRLPNIAEYLFYG